MPGKTKKTATSPTPTQKNALSFSSVQARIEFLNKKHKKLLTQIKRQKTQLSNLTEEMQTLAQEMQQKSRPFYEKFHSLDREVHSLFDKILTKQRLGKRQKQEVKNIYRILQLSGRISPRFDEFSKSAQNVKDEAEKSTEKDFFGSHNHSHETDSRFWEEADISQPRPNRDIRKIFLKLADKFHPDKASDDETRAYYTEIMKEINIAYQSGDLARLLEISMDKNQEKVKFSPNDSEKECEGLEKEIELLSQQYEQIKAEVREVKKTPQGNMVKQYRKAKQKGENLIELLVEDTELELNNLTELRDFVKAFQQKKITLQDFLRGPVSGDIDNMEYLVNEMFEDMFVVINL